MGARPAWHWAGLFSLIVLLQSWAMAVSTPLGIPPDELAHISYIQDVVDGAPIPDYGDGRIGNSEQRNYLAHPPLYYSALGALCRIADIDPTQSYKKLRMLSA